MTKNAFLSVGFVSSLIAMLAGALGFSGVLQTDPNLPTDTATWVLALVAVLGGAGGVYGRWTAKTALHLVTPSINTMRALAFVALMPMLLIPIAGCQTATALLGADREKSYEQIAYETAIAAVDTYHGLQKLTLVYGHYPYCDPAQPAVLLCKKPKQWARVKVVTEAVTKKMESLVPLIDAHSDDVAFLMNVAAIVNQAQVDIAQAKKDD